MEVKNAIAIAQHYLQYLRKSNEYCEALDTLIKAANNPAVIKAELNDYSWHEISIIASKGFANKIFKLGDTKIDYMQDGTTIQYRIIGFNHDRENSITFEAVRTYKDIVFSDSLPRTNVYKDSDVHKYLNGEFLDLVSEELKEEIRKVKKFTRHGDTDSTFYTQFFILSEQEIYGHIFYSYGNEGKWYDYYKQENVPYTQSNARWLRSPYDASSNTIDEYDVCFVDSRGLPGVMRPKKAYGVLPAFCI